MRQSGRASASASTAYLGATLVAASCTAMARLVFSYLDLADVVMIYLVGVVVVSTRRGLWPSVFTAALSVLAFDFFFVPPYYTLAVHDLRYIVTFGVMFLVAVVIGTLTERVRAESEAAVRRADEAERARNEAERARAETLRARTEAETERLRSSLLSSVSHDLRTPLAVIKGAATTIQQGGGESSAKDREELLQTIVDESTRMARLVGNLVEMTRVESGKLTPRREPQSIEELIGGALARMEKHLGDRVVRTDVPSDLPFVLFDPVLIEQVLLNLLHNVVRHTPLTAGLLIRALVDGDWLVVEVRDEGKGLPPGSEERVFDKFFRASDGAGDGGMGLGLAICRAIVTAHGGDISASNPPGGGALFRMRLPFDHRELAIESPPEIDTSQGGQTPSGLAPLKGAES